MRVLITGAAGFIGAEVVRRALSEGHDVIALVRPGTDRRRLREVESGLSVTECDLGDPDAITRTVAAAGPELCVHLAWRGAPGVGPEAEANVGALIASLELVRALRAVGCRRFVAAGTCFEYADMDTAHVEGEPAAPRDLYSLAKNASLTLCSELCRVAGISMAWPRVFYTYGPREDTRRLVSSVIVGLLEGRTVATTPGAQIRDDLHVEDVADAILAVALSSVTGPVNVASGSPVSVRDVVDALGRLIGRPELLRIGELAYRPNEPMTIKADVGMLRRMVGWQPRYSLAEGLRHTVEWWRAERTSSSEAGAMDATP